MKTEGINKKIKALKRFKKGILLIAAIFIVGTVETSYFGGIIVAQAHSGRTDSQGGHKDNKNKSGLGSYHYHHGYSAHLHPDGVCPIENGNGASSASEKKAEPALKIEDYSLIFETVYYYNNNPDIQANVGNGGQNLLEHFVNFGMAEGRRGSSNFDVMIYKDNNKDLEETFGDNLKKYYEHYMNTGYKENRKHN